MQESYNVIQIGNKIIINLIKEGITFEKKDIDDKLKKEIYVALKNSDKDTLMKIFYPGREKLLIKKNEIEKLFDSIKSSSLLEQRGKAIYMPSVSELSLPMDLVKAIIKAEQEKETDKLTAYKNFWTLMSLNTDSRCRENLFWYLNKWGMKIAKCGFFVGYRNVDKTEEEEVFTDHHSHTTRIKIGEMVTMDRNSCDTVQEHQCSTGLHLSNIGWLKEGYFGEVGIACLCNPADVCAVPHNSSYGKLRTCAYLPIAFVKYDDKKDVIPLDIEDGFDCKYVTKVIYEGLMGTEDDSPYKINIPQVPELNKESIQKSLFNIAFDCITNKVVK